MMLSLNQLKYILVGFFQNHGQIKQVHYSSDFDFNAERNLLFPVVNIEYLNSTAGEKQTIHSYRVTIADLTDPDYLAIDDEVVSDAHQVAEDFFAFLQEDERFKFQTSVAIEPFTDDMGHRTAGITFRINLAVFRHINQCLKP